MIITELREIIHKECWIKHSEHKNFWGRVLSYLGGQYYLCIDTETGITYEKEIKDIGI